MKRDFTTGNVFQNILYYSLPYLLSYFLQTLYGMADLFIIGQFDGVAATTAVSIGGQVMHMVTVMIVGLAMGTTVSIAQAVGAKQHKEASRCIGNTAVMFMALSVVLAVGMLFTVRPIVGLVSTPEEAVEGTVTYLSICFAGIPFITAYNVISSIFRGLGDSKSPMYFIGIACVVNIVLDYVFMGALHLGPAGAALGTTLSQAVSVAISLFVILRRKESGISVEKSDFRLHKPTISCIFSIGFPVAIQDGLIQVSFIIITIIANRRGLTDAAAVGIVEKIVSFLFLIPSSMLSTVSALGAQNIGAGKRERAVQTLRYAIGIATGLAFVVAIIIQFVAEPVVGLFTTDSAACIAGGQYLRGYVFDCVLAGIQFSFSGYFCACGKSILSFIHNICSIVFVRVPGAYLTSMLFPTTLLPMGLATACGSLFSSVLCVIFFIVMRKKERREAALS